MNEYVVKVKDKLCFVKSIFDSNLALKVVYTRTEEDALVFMNLESAYNVCNIIYNSGIDVLVVALRTFKVSTYQYRELQ